MMVSKCPCLTLRDVINSQMAKSHWFLCINSSTFNLIGPCKKHPNIQSHKGTNNSTTQMESNQTIVADKIMAEYFFNYSRPVNKESQQQSYGLTDLDQGTRATIKSIRTSRCSTLYVFKRQKWRKHCKRLTAKRQPAGTEFSLSL